MNLHDERISTIVNRLSDIIRNDYVSDSNNLELYVGQETIEAIDNVKYQIIYGRRGTGKTHLLKAYKQTLVNKFEQEKYYPIYIDLRKLIPLLSNAKDNSIESAIIIFINIVEKIVEKLIDDIKFFCNHKNILEKIFSNENSIRKSELTNLIQKFRYQVIGTNFEKFNDCELSIENSQDLSDTIGLALGKNSSFKYDNVEKYNYKSKHNTKSTKYISFAEISDNLTQIISILGIKRVICILDEWSEVPSEVQLVLADLIKRSFITNPFTFKIAAIPNRINLGKMCSENYIGLEEGGDIFGYNLDNRLIYEDNPEKTKDFFNDLLYRHLTDIDKKIGYNLLNTYSKSRFINEFLANVALREILIASAGIPRDFISLFINAYGDFKIKTSSGSKKIGAKNIRVATVEWYKVDKESAVNKIEGCKTMLRSIMEIVKASMKTHFLILQKYSDNYYLKNLIDFRVIHLRKKGYSHQDNVGMVYDVYSIDYGCYTSIDIFESKLDGDFISNINSVDNFRQIRRISLEEDFFEKFTLEIGEGFKCSSCNNTVDVNHLAYIKQGVCNHCFEKVDRQE